MDFEQIRKDMEDGSPGPWWYEDDDMLILDRHSEEIIDCGLAFEVDCRRIARVHDLERIALAAEKYRKATVAYRSTEGGAEALSTFLGVEAARAELFALLTSKDAT